MLSTILAQQNPWWETGKLKIKLFPRAIENELLKNISDSKILGLIGSRQVGKTSLMLFLIHHLLKKVPPKDILYFNLDDILIHELFSTPSRFLEYLRPEGYSKKYIFIDEVQRLKNPGLFLKTIVDLRLPLKIIVSGSSQLEMRSKLKEFLVGRMRQFMIRSFTFSETRNVYPRHVAEDILESSMMFGGYPAIVKERHIENKKNLLQDIYKTYLQKDVSDFAKIDDIGAFNNLLIILAAQIGGLLNIYSLAKTLRISSYTVSHYLDILENTAIIYRLRPFFRNYKKEIAKTPKIYFLDLGLRNFLINDWKPLALREDRGKLFENFILLELIGNDSSEHHRFSFWRTTNQTEIDFIQSDGLKLAAIEAKWNKKTFPKAFSTFKKYYPGSRMKVITRENFSGC